MDAATEYGLEDHPFFSDWTREEIAVIRNSIVEFSVPAGKVFFEVGDNPDGCYLIEKGDVALFAEIDGMMQEIERRGPGDSFGEVSMMAREPHRMRAVAMTDTRVAEIPEIGDSACLFAARRCPVTSILRPMIRHLGRTAMLSSQKVREKEKLALIGRMVNDIVHDFKSPFQTITLGTEAIGSITRDPQVARLCSSITNQVNRMLAMAGELAEFSRGQEGLVFEKVKLPRLLEDLHEACASCFERRSLEICVDVPDIEAEISHAGMVRVLQNLMMNASEAMPKGGRIDLAARAENGLLVITFADNGPGIPEVIRESFWQPFVTSGKKGGVGLGSSIVRSIVESHGGHIDFVTEAGKGTTFTIRLPLSHSLPQRQSASM
jgi:signal transduction histidine kinase